MARILPTKRPINRRYIGDKTNFSPKNRRKFSPSTHLPARAADVRFFHRKIGDFRFFSEKSPINPIFGRFFFQSSFPWLFLFEADRKTIFLRFFGEKIRNFCPWSYFIYCHLVFLTVYYHRIAVLCFSYHVIYYMHFICIYLSYTFLFHIMYCSYTFHVLYFSYIVILYFTSCSYNCLYFSYHVI